ncbi:hypothetical protein [Pleurocapsa sp. PCC 7327]|nr:hypothetical protein [Pleurocapsa sp. PCC 7327]
MSILLIGLAIGKALPQEIADFNASNEIESRPIRIIGFHAP